MMEDSTAGTFLVKMVAEELFDYIEEGSIGPIKTRLDQVSGQTAELFTLTNQNNHTLLTFACNEGHHKIVALLLKVQGIDPNAGSTKSGKTVVRPPLHIATQKGFHLVVQELLKHPQIKVNSNFRGKTPLMRAVDVSKAERTKGKRTKFVDFDKTVTALLEHPKIRVHDPREKRMTPLHLAAANGNELVLKMLLNHGPKDEYERLKTPSIPDAKGPWTGVNTANDDGKTALYYAIKNSHVWCVDELLNHVTTGTVTLADGWRWHPSDIDIDNVSRGATGTEVQSALQLAGDRLIALKGKHGSVQMQTIIILLMGHQLCRAARENDIATLETLLNDPEYRSDAIINGQYRIASKNYMTVLGFAAFNGHREAVELLLGVPTIKLNQLDGCYSTALHRACFYGRADVVRTLINFKPSSTRMGADVNRREQFCEGKEPGDKPKTVGPTALFYAAARASLRSEHQWEVTWDAAASPATGDHLACVRILLAHKNGATDPNVPERTGLYPIMVAAYDGSDEIVEALLAHRDKSGRPAVDAGVCDDSGDTALHVAAEHGHLNVVRQLLNYHHLRPFGFNGQNADGNTALMLAAAEGHVGIVNILLERNYAGAHADDTSRWPVNVMAENLAGETALTCASKHGHTEVVHALVQAYKAFGAEQKALDLHRAISELRARQQQEENGEQQEKKDEGQDQGQDNKQQQQQQQPLDQQNTGGGKSTIPAAQGAPPPVPEAQKRPRPSDDGATFPPRKSVPDTPAAAVVHTTAGNAQMWAADQKDARAPAPASNTLFGASTSSSAAAGSTNLVDAARQGDVEAVKAILRGRGVGGRGIPRADMEQALAEASDPLVVHLLNAQDPGALSNTLLNRAASFASSAAPASTVVDESASPQHVACGPRLRTELTQRLRHMRGELGKVRQWVTELAQSLEHLQSFVERLDE